jgi:hypothetical protein
MVKSIYILLLIVYNHRTTRVCFSPPEFFGISPWSRWYWILARNRSIDQARCRCNIPTVQLYNLKPHHELVCLHHKRTWFPKMIMCASSPFIEAKIREPKTLLQMTISILSELQLTRTWKAIRWSNIYSSFKPTNSRTFKHTKPAPAFSNRDLLYHSCLVNFDVLYISVDF